MHLIFCYQAAFDKNNIKIIFFSSLFWVNEKLTSIPFSFEQYVLSAFLLKPAKGNFLNQKPFPYDWVERKKGIASEKRKILSTRNWVWQKKMKRA